MRQLVIWWGILLLSSVACFVTYIWNAKDSRTQQVVQWAEADFLGSFLKKISFDMCCYIFGILPTWKSLLTFLVTFEIILITISLNIVKTPMCVLELNCTIKLLTFIIYWTWWTQTSCFYLNQQLNCKTKFAWCLIKGCHNVQLVCTNKQLIFFKCFYSSCREIYSIRSCSAARS